MKSKRRSYSEIKDQINSDLEFYQQKLRILSINSKKIELNNGIVLINDCEDKSLSRIKLLGLNLNSYIYADQLFNVDREIRLNARSSIKSINSSIAAKLAWEKSGDKIKQKMKGRIPWNSGLTAETDSRITAWNKGLTKETDSRVMEYYSINRMGKNNPMFGKHIPEETKIKQSQHIKYLIKEGLFTPNSNNRNTFWDSYYDGIKFRSSWEALFYYFNPSTEYEKTRIEYIFENKKRIYITDFTDDINKIVYEIKPSVFLDNPLMRCKIDFAHKWCKDNNYEFKIITEDYFKALNFIDDGKFDDSTLLKIRKFYENC